LAVRAIGRGEGKMVQFAVVGAGTMGAGIAESAALAGMFVAMIDVREEALERGMQTIEQDLARRVKKGRISEDESRDVIERVQTTTLIEGCSGTPLVVEAVVEDAEVKKRVFERYYYQPHFRPSFLQRTMVEAGDPGRKSGRGFYDYTENADDRNNGADPPDNVALRVIESGVRTAPGNHPTKC